jgi:predicted Fe-Mo cluster-binding NifX family protein
VSVMLAGGIGEGAINKLSEHGIKVIRNCRGNASEQVKRYLEGLLEDGGQSCESHEHGHECKH